MSTPLLLYKYAASYQQCERQIMVTDYEYPTVLLLGVAGLCKSAAWNVSTEWNVMIRMYRPTCVRRESDDHEDDIIIIWRLSSRIY